ncbi:hypothetical protein CRE_08990 [Caenorhabditis remanei]|uniref:G-protein coupled receptors family 1 profile domain-containing protein n=1 Tax=Caenorhabditis remanei TaxID=31234 RepID=E3LIM7_CAERE|nr:hypothetical protein CRE_08990 [Caenorhabditis remanei]
MISSSINVLMTGIAVCDIFNMAEPTWLLLYFMKYDYDVAQLVSPFCYGPLSFSYRIFERFFTITGGVARPVAAWLAMTMALFRLLIVKNAMNSSFESLSTLRVGVITVLCNFFPFFIFQFITYYGFKLHSEEWFYPEICGYPPSSSVISYYFGTSYLFLEESFDYYSIYTIVTTFAQLIPAMILPFLAFSLIREIGKGRLARRQLMRSQAANAKPDNTTIVISTMTVVSMLAEMPYGIHSMFFLYYTEFSRDTDMIELLVLLQGPFQSLIAFNTMSHCLISLAVSSQYQNAVVSLFPIVRKLKKPRNIIRVTPSGSSEGNMMTRVTNGS